jgi:hypothetical protein
MRELRHSVQYMMPGDDLGQYALPAGDLIAAVANADKTNPLISVNPTSLQLQSSRSSTPSSTFPSLPPAPLPPPHPTSQRPAGPSYSHLGGVPASSTAIFKVSLPAAETPASTSTAFVWNVTSDETRAEHIKGIPFSIEHHFHDPVFGRFLLYMKRCIPWWVLSAGVGQPDAQFLGVAIQAYQGTMGHSTPPICLDPHQTDLVITIIGKLIGDTYISDLKTVMELILQQRDSSGSPPPLYYFHPTDINSPLDQLMANIVMAQFITQPPGFLFIHGMEVICSSHIPVTY